MAWPTATRRLTAAVLLVILVLSAGVGEVVAPVTGLAPTREWRLPSSEFVSLTPSSPETATTAPSWAPDGVTGGSAPIRVVVRTPRRASPPAPWYPPLATTHSLRGVATWYCEPGVSACVAGLSPWGAYAAAGPALRAALGNWRGRSVKVCMDRCLVVKLVDWCACGGGHLIDLYHSVLVRITSSPWGGEARVSW